jgi:hypothetical protein
VTQRRLSMTLGSIAIAVILFTTDMARAQQYPAAQETPQPQQPAVRPVQPIVGGRHLQPERRDLQELGVPAPSRQEVQEMDRLMQQLLDRSGSGQDKADRP